MKTPAALPARFALLRPRDLMLLAHVEELGSLTQAAARMHVTQLAITQALQSLEECAPQLPDTESQVGNTNGSRFHPFSAGWR